MDQEYGFQPGWSPSVQPATKISAVSYDANTGMYTVTSTGKQYSVVSTLISYLRSKKYQNIGIPVPDDMWDELRLRAAKEAEDAKVNKKRRATLRKEEKRLKFQQDYDDIRLQSKSDSLYRRDLVICDEQEEVRYDCGACKVFIPQNGFLSHVSSSEHRRTVLNSTFEEDDKFIAAEKEAIQTTNSIHCTHCDKWIPSNSWEPHIIGKPHRRASGQTTAVVTSVGQPKSSLPVATAVGSSDSVVMDLSEANQNSVIEKFDSNAIPVFGCGEQMWEIGIGFSEAEYCHLPGYKTEMCVTDADSWGSSSKPGLVAGLVRDTNATSLGVLYTVTRPELEQLILNKKPHKLILVEAEHENGKCVAFRIPGEISPMTINSAAEKIASAVGPSGPNYNLLGRIQHEYQRQGWKDNYITKLMETCNGILWPNG